MSVHLRLIHANSNAKLHAEHRQGSVNNYFIGSDRSGWRTDVPNYAAVRYEVYPGIDWVVCDDHSSWNTTLSSRRMPIRRGSGSGSKVSRA